MQSQTPAPAPARNTFDYVYLKDLQLSAVVGQDAWGRADKPQPALVSVKWYQALSGVDNLQETLNYSKMAKDITESIDNRRGGFVSAQSLAEFIQYVSVNNQWGGLGLYIEVHLPKAVLYAGNGLKLVRSYQLEEMEPGREVFSQDQLYPRAMIEDVKVLCVIGVNPHEREAKQMVRLDFEIEEDLRFGAPDGIASHWRELVKHAVEVSLLPDLDGMSKGYAN